MNQNKTKELIIVAYKGIVYGLLLLTFLLTMRFVNYAVVQQTRTAIVTASAFALVFLMSQNIYGNFEIGQKKSKPVFLSTMISILISNTVATLTMIIMGIEQFPLPGIIIKVIPFFILTYLLHGMLVWTAAHIGNDLYFKLYNADRVLIINQNDRIYNKIYKYVSSHNKQYNIVNTVTECSNNLLESKNIDTVYAIGVRNEEFKELVNYCYKHSIKLNYDINFYDVILGKKDTFVIDDVLMMEITPYKIGIIQSFIKRTIDIIGGLVLLIISIPIFIIVGIAIKLDDGGPIFFLQSRLTLNNKSFYIIKFRSMKLNAGSTPVTEHDDRITKVGHIIRKLRIDELPQAINILKGDISLVGPRPESTAHAAKISETLPDFHLRLRVKGGLTGYAQIFGKYNTTPEMKLLLDLKYIENQSTIEDLKLIFQTLKVFVRSDSTEGFESEDNIK